MLEFMIYGIGFFVCTLFIQYMLFKLRKNHNHGSNGVWVGTKAIMVLCVIGIIRCGCQKYATSKISSLTTK